jgi:hypothetical protein
MTIPALAAVDGTVINGATGKPQPNTLVTLVQPGQAGMQTLGTAKSDAQGHFKFDKSGEGGPQLIQAVYEGVLYTQMIPPGTPTSAIQVVVYDATPNAAIATLEQHAIFLQPGAEQIEIAENLLFKNDSKKTFNDESKGTVRFYLPPAAKGKASVTINTVGGMPIQRSAEPAGSGNLYKIDYPIKPGETLFTINYSVPGGNPNVYASRILGDKGALLVVPSGVSLTGDVTEDGVEPRFNAPKYRVAAGDFKVTVQGAGSFTESGGTNASAAADDSGAPQLSESKPRIYDQLYTVLGLALGILALGFVALYRARTGDTSPPAKGHQRG